MPQVRTTLNAEQDKKLRMLMIEFGVTTKGDAIAKLLDDTDVNLKS